VTGSLAADIRERTSLLQRLAPCSTRRDHDCITELRERQEVPAIQRQLGDLAVFNHVADFGGRDLQERQRALDFDLFAQALHAQGEVERDAATDFEKDSVRLR